MNDGPGATHIANGPVLLSQPVLTTPYAPDADTHSDGLVPSEMLLSSGTQSMSMGQWQGVKGNLDARIFCTCLEPQLISIAGIYRTGETPWPDAYASKPAQVRLADNTLVFEPLRMK